MQRLYDIIIKIKYDIIESPTLIKPNFPTSSFNINSNVINITSVADPDMAYITGLSREGSKCKLQYFDDSYMTIERQYLMPYAFITATLYTWYYKVLFDKLLYQKPVLFKFNLSTYVVLCSLCWASGF